jgi:hypothetical protein
VSEHSPEATRRVAYKIFEGYFSGSSEADFNRHLDDVIKYEMTLPSIFCKLKQMSKSEL